MPVPNLGSKQTVLGKRQRAASPPSPLSSIEKRLRLDRSPSNRENVNPTINDADDEIEATEIKPNRPQRLRRPTMKFEVLIQSKPHLRKFFERVEVALPTRKIASIASEFKVVKSSLKTPTKSKEVECLPIAPAKRAEVVTPQASETPIKLSTNVYARARSVFKLALDLTTLGDTSTRSMLLGRDTERSALLAFLVPRLPHLYADLEFLSETESNGSILYISGQPGTGKTALLVETLEDIRLRQTQIGIEAGETRLIMINCAAVQSQTDLWRCILLHADGQVLESTKACKGAYKEVVRRVTSPDSKERFLVVLDEVDHLFNTHRSTPKKSGLSDQSSGPNSEMSRLLTLASSPDSRLILIGVANALDLGQSCVDLNNDFSDDVDLFPIRLHFPPYQAEGLSAIAKQRLSALSVSNADEKELSIALPLFTPPAFELAARKVQAASGDLRSFLDVLSKALTFVETQQIAALTGGLPTPTPSPNSGHSKTSARRGDVDPLAHFTLATAPKVSPQYVLRALKVAQFTTSDEVASRVADLVLHERLALVSILIGCNRLGSNVQAINASDAYSTYEECMTSDGLSIVSPVGRSEWEDLLSGLKVKTLLEVALAGNTPTKSAAGRAKKTLITLAHPSIKLVDLVKGAGHVEACAMARSILDRESRRLRKIHQPTQDDAPLAGFHGKGLDYQGVTYLGAKERGVARDERWD